MKKTTTLLLSSLFVGGSLLAQQFSDDFESYNTGDYLGEKSSVWRCWSNVGEGTPEDVKIVDDEAASGTKSIYFSSTSANGGPQDVVLPFGKAYNTGTFDFKFKIKVNSGKNAYFNFQASETIGQTWAMDCFFNGDGSLELKNSGTTYLTSTYDQGDWFEFHLNIDLSTNIWELFVDGQSKGAFNNPVLSIALLDLYPLQGSEFWVDDVEFEHTEASSFGTNATTTNIFGLTNTIVGQTKHLEVEVRNLGTSPITSLDINVDNNGTQILESFSNLNIEPLAFSTFTLSEKAVISGSGTISACVDNVNGAGKDENTSDDCKSVQVNPIVPAPGKLVIGEEGTGTWCGWCPRGAVSMDHMAENYEGLFQGLAVHNADPMTNTAYDAWMGGNIAGYPSGLVNRGAEMDPSAFEDGFFQQITVAPKVSVDHFAAYDEQTGKLTVTVYLNFLETVTGQWNVACAIVEDGVKGSSAQYNQANYYSGGGNGVMGGYEALPNPVPANQMVYDDVARSILPSPSGEAVGSGISAGSEFSFVYTFDIDASWDINEMSIVPMVMNNSGAIDNADSKTVEEATGILELTKASNVNAVLAPNPTSDFTSVTLDIQAAADVEIQVLSAEGKIVMQRAYGSQSGSLNFPIVTSSLESGVYFVNVKVGEESTTNKLIIE